MINVYISKSNDANLDDIIAVRNQLELHQTKVKILEHSGGKYDESLIKKADLVIMIPSKPSTVSAIIGKGLYSQATVTNAPKVVYCGGRGYFSFTAVEAIDGANWNKCAKLFFGNKRLTLNEVLYADKLEDVTKENMQPVTPIKHKKDYRQLL